MQVLCMQEGANQDHSWRSSMGYAIVVMLTFFRDVLQAWVVVGARSSLQSMHLHGGMQTSAF